MTPTNMILMDFETKEAMKDFLEMYERDINTLHPDAEMLLTIKITGAGCVGVSIYPDADARNLLKSRTSVELKHFFSLITHINTLYFKFKLFSVKLLFYFACISIYTNNFAIDFGICITLNSFIVSYFSMITSLTKSLGVAKVFKIFLIKVVNHILC